jgi:phosphoribosylformylglycinamidine synthase PurS subunit
MARQWPSVQTCGPDRRSRQEEDARTRFVTPKPSCSIRRVRTIAEHCIARLPAAVQDVRQGKYFELDLATTEAAQAKALASEVADKLLANPVIESYRVEIDSCQRQLSHRAGELES